MRLFGAILLFLVFAVNIGLGAGWDRAFLNDIGELLVLAGVAILFVIAILKKEADAD